MATGTAYVIDLLVDRRRPHRVKIADEAAPRDPFPAPGGVVYILERVECVERCEDDGSWHDVLRCEPASQVVVVVT